MNIGIPKELKPFEGRVALTPQACENLVIRGHTVFIQQDAGILSGYSNAEYQQLGVNICRTAKQLYEQCSLIVKVKEPISGDLQYLTSKHTLFCFLHLAANPSLTQELAEIGLTAIGFELLREKNSLPLLKPMSEIAGKLSIQIGVNLLHLEQGGSGILLGGLDNSTADNGNVLVLGAGSAGKQAALLAHAMGANVTAYDHSEEALFELKSQQTGINTISNIDQCLALVPTTDLMIGALLVTGKQTPKLIRREHVKTMKNGSVIVDISVDQGGCIETTKPTSYDAPTYIKEGVTHFCVTNMPGAVPRTATQALSALLPDYIHRLTINNFLECDEIMKNAVNINAGKVIY